MSTACGASSAGHGCILTLTVGIFRGNTRAATHVRPSGSRLRSLQNFQMMEIKKGSSDRTRTYKVNSGLPRCCWELPIVADSFIALPLPILRYCRIE
jgi:hypothetical protein